MDEWWRKRKPEVPHPFGTMSKEVIEAWTSLYQRPRVIKARELGEVQPGTFQVRRATTEAVGLKTFVAFFEEFPPQGYGAMHGHMNEAVFYILRGRGYELHDGERFDWEAGDVVIIPNGCVHRHINADPTEPAQAVVFNPRPFFLNMNLSATRLVHRPGEGPH